MQTGAPELTLEQKAYRTRITYRFFEPHVEYTIIDSRGDKASFSVKYEDVPPRFDYRTFEPRKVVIAIQICIVMVMALVMIAAYPADSLPVLAFTACWGAIVIGCSNWVRRRYFRKIYTSLPTRNGKILVLRNKLHNKVMEEIEARRRKALRKFAMIDALNAPQAELRRLRWLKDEGAITPLEFENYRRALGPAALVPDALPEPEIAEAGPFTLAQRSYRFRSEFTFHPDFLRYEMNDGALSAFNVHYKELPHPTEYRTFMKRDGLAAFVLCIGALLGMALVNVVESNKFYATPVGQHQVLLAAAIFVPALIVLVLSARRYSRKEFTIVPVTKGSIRVLQDAQHDRVIGEIQTRRHATLRAQAVIDRANPPQGELRKFQWLKEQGIITDTEFESFRQKLLEAIADRQASAPAKPPTETLH